MYLGRSSHPYPPKLVEGVSVLENSSMSPWSPDQGLKDPFSAVFLPWFGGVGLAFDLPTGQTATFSTGWGVLRSPYAEPCIGPRYADGFIHF